MERKNLIQVRAFKELINTMRKKKEYDELNICRKTKIEESSTHNKELL